MTPREIKEIGTRCAELMTEAIAKSRPSDRPNVLVSITSFMIGFMAVGLSEMGFEKEQIRELFSVVLEEILGKV
jgi:hypothetical protein